MMNQTDNRVAQLEDEVRMLIDWRQKFERHSPRRSQLHSGEKNICNTNYFS